MGFNDINLQVSGPQQPASTYKTKVLKGQVPFAVQVTEPNTKYVIKHNFELDGDVTIPENCILEFDGGSISGEYTLNLNSAKILGRGIDCLISNPNTDDEIVVSQYLKSISNVTKNTSVIQVLLNTGCPVFVDINGVIELNSSLSVLTSIIVRGLDRNKTTLSFPNSKGFAWNNSQYSHNNIVKDLKVISKNESFDFYCNGNIKNVYISLFKNLDVQSLNSSCFYAGPNVSEISAGDICFDCKFENISVKAAEYGFYGINSNTQYFYKIDIHDCAISAFCNCAGTFISVNGAFGNTPHVLTVNGTSSDNTMSRSVFIGCNFEQYSDIEFLTNEYGTLDIVLINCIIQHHPDKYTLPFIYTNYIKLALIGCDLQRKDDFVNGIVKVRNASNSNVIITSDWDITVNNEAGSIFTVPANIGRFYYKTNLFASDSAERLVSCEEQKYIRNLQVSSFYKGEIVNNPVITDNVGVITLTSAANIKVTSGNTLSRFAGINMEVTCNFEFYLTNATGGNLTIKHNYASISGKCITSSNADIVLADGDVVRCTVLAKMYGVFIVYVEALPSINV